MTIKGQNLITLLEVAEERPLRILIFYTGVVYNEKKTFQVNFHHITIDMDTEEFISFK